MKNKILIIVCILAVFSCKAQTISLTTVDYTNVPDNAYVKDIDGKLNPFIGTWKWIDGNSEFTVVFVKKEMYDAGGTSRIKQDKIIGGYKYIENGIEIVNTLNFTTDFDPNDISTFDNYAKIITQIDNSFLELSFGLFDKVKDKYCEGTLELIDPLVLNGNFVATTAQWKMWQRETFTETPSAQGFSIPTDIVLTKQ
ncbi:hypothetical protein FG167_08460 [Lacinutrix sp. WUR7]|uniref:DUF6705 family protein n=1 Tax=Lacinutrix sp. WUR7 TaxID=2653681 RepID=UPI00193EA9EF|nr:DUF6705 family protein [Lacinutrix sp. WUR7]QRM89262.1 hypothetical protein FG167_08460 [Lacinutrix sp. WUR7]